MKSVPKGTIPQKMNVHDPAAIAAAGFGDPGQQFSVSSAEMEAVEQDAALIAGFNQQAQAPKAPVTKPRAVQARRPVPPKPAPTPAPVQEEEPQEEIQEEENDGVGLELSDNPAERLKQVSAALKEIDPNAPVPEQLAQWKQVHGDIFILYMFDKAFVYRYLKRAEWIKMNLDESFQNMRQDQIEDYIFDRCVLWPTFGVAEKARLPAGTVPSLSEQIRMNSMFVDPARLSQFTVKL